MRNPGGYAVMTGPTGQVERDTFTCCHCNFVVHVEPKADPASLGGQCRLCNKLVCPGCVGKKCVPFERRLEAIEARDRLMKSIGIG